MPHYPGDEVRPHLPLLRQDVNPARRKQKPPPPVNLDRGGRQSFGNSLTSKMKALEDDAARESSPIPGIRPHLVFKVPVAANTSPNRLVEPFGKVGIKVVSVEPDGVVIAFKEDASLSEFKAAVVDYQSGPSTAINPKTKKPFATTPWDIFEIIEVDQMERYGRSDRIGSELARSIGSNGDTITRDQLFILDVELWHGGSKVFANESMKELRSLVGDGSHPDERVRDTFVGDLFCLARVSVYGEKLDQLLELKVVAEVEFPPSPSINASQLASATRRDFPIPPTPLEDGPSLCILDSGVTSNHPLLASNIGHAEAIMTNDSTPADVSGHGTKVAGIAIFGDVLAAYQSGVFASPITLYSARVLNRNNKFDDEKLLITQVRQAIETFYKAPYNCRVFNLSVGNDLAVLPNNNGKQTQWAEDLDTLARELKVILVVAAGNHKMDEATNREEAEMVLDEYPNYLFENGAALSDPATSAIAITVGGIAQHESPEDWTGEDRYQDLDRPVARKGQPTPSTRIGPGINDAYKPEFVSHAGNSALRGSGPMNHIINSTMGYGVLSFSHNIQSTLFAADVGTSFAAPYVARIASIVWHRIKELIGRDPHPNLVRALLANSATLPDPTCKLISRAKGDEFVRRVCGYGIPDEELAVRSSNRRVTMLASASLQIDTFYIYQVPITEEFLSSNGSKQIIVSLAFDPPVRRRRAKYLGVAMQASLFRGKTVAEIVAANTPTPSEDRESPVMAIQGAYRCPLKPGTTDFASSTLQRYEWAFRQSLREYGDTYYLVVKAFRNWAPIEITHQDFSVAVTLQSSNPELYASIRERIQQRVRTRRSS